MSERPLLMIPGPIEVSEAVLRAASAPPPGHLAPPLIAVPTTAGTGQSCACATTLALHSGSI